MPQLSEKYVQFIKPENATKMYADGGTGLYLVVQPTGTKTFIWRWRCAGTIKKITIGRVGTMKLTEARDVAISYTAAVKAGRDPHLEIKQERTKTRFSVDDAWKLYVKHVASKQKTAKEKERIYEKDIKPTLGSTALASLTRDDCERLVLKVSERSQGGGLSVYALMSAFLKWCCTHGRLMTGLEVSPMANSVKPRTDFKPRDRYLSEKEIGWFLLACEAVREEHKGKPAARWALVAEILLRTGQRESTITELVEREVEFDEGLMTIPPARHKGGREHVLPLPPKVIELIKSAPRPDASKLFFQRLCKKEASLNVLRKKVDEIAGKELDHWYLHALRKTVDTHLRDAEENDVDVADHATIEAILGHTLKGVQVHYNMSRMLKKKRRALWWWEAQCERLKTKAQRAAAA